MTEVERLRRALSVIATLDPPIHENARPWLREARRIARTVLTRETVMSDEQPRGTFEAPADDIKEQDDAVE